MKDTPTQRAAKSSAPPASAHFGKKPVPPEFPPAPRRRLPAAERRELILDAAMNAFADTGYHQTSLEEVARRAGVSKALIYDHFSSKQELYRELLETYVHELLERVVRRRSRSRRAVRRG